MPSNYKQANPNRSASDRRRARKYGEPSRRQQKKVEKHNRAYGKWAKSGIEPTYLKPNLRWW